MITLVIVTNQHIIDRLTAQISMISLTSIGKLYIYFIEYFYGA